MPTLQQLNDIWEMEFNHPWTRREDDPMYVRPERFNAYAQSKGEIIGHIEIDPDTDGVRIVVDKTEAE